MPEEIEVPLEHAQAHIEEAHKEQQGKTGGAHEKGKDNWTRFIAVVTALLAVLAAIGALRAGQLVNEALLAKNDQLGHLTQASDTWNYYQAEGLKALIYKTSAQALPPGSPVASEDKRQAAYYKAKQAGLQKDAQELEAKAKENGEESERKKNQHEIFAFSVSLCQIAIALSAVAALTHNRRIWYFGVTAGLLGVAALLAGFLGLRLPFAF